jgi:hypothetical protein
MFSTIIHRFLEMSLRRRWDPIYTHYRLILNFLLKDENGRGHLAYVRIYIPNGLDYAPFRRNTLLFLHNYLNPFTVMLNYWEHYS